jgi:hypothetical protein
MAQGGPVSTYAPITVITSELTDVPLAGTVEDTLLINRAYDHGLRVAVLDIVSYATEANLFEPARPNVWRVTFEAKT